MYEDRLLCMSGDQQQQNSARRIDEIYWSELRLFSTADGAPGVAIFDGRDGVDAGLSTQGASHDP